MNKEGWLVWLPIILLIGLGMAFAEVSSNMEPWGGDLGAWLLGWVSIRAAIEIAYRAGTRRTK